MNKKNIFSPFIFLIALLFLGLSNSLMAQLTIIIESVPLNTPDNSSIYLAGNINQWNPADKTYRFKGNANDQLLLQLDSLVAGDVLDFKFTLGTWDLVEIDSYGVDIPNRSYVFDEADTLFVSIGAWSNPALKSSLKSTASYNVEIISDSFYMPQLDDYRRIWIYLPPDYDFEDELDYPVLYMHDGQNLFDKSRSFSGEWQVDESLNALFDMGATIPIVIGIDHGGVNRVNEYNMRDAVEPQINAQGEQYLDFIIFTLKPYIDSHYRTRPERDFTGIMGSSVGGLISCYAILYHGDVFSLAGLFSPSYWLDSTIYEQALPDLPFRIYQMCGTDESDKTQANTEKMHTLFVSQLGGEENTKLKIVPGGKHNEKLWAKEFKDAILFLYSPEE